MTNHRKTKEIRNHRRLAIISDFSLLAPPAGLEPATSWLTVMRSTDWAKEEYEWNEYSDSAQSVSAWAKEECEWNCWRGYGKTITPRQPEGVAFCVGNELSFRSVSRQVFLPQQSLTSVFGMGTGGPSALKSPTMRPTLSLEINCLQFIQHCRTNYGTELIKRNVCQQWAIFPARLQASIFATAELNFRVRNGNGWTLCVKITDYMNVTTSIGNRTKRLWVERNSRNWLAEQDTRIVRVSKSSSPRSISIDQLHALLHFHLRPIKLVVYKWPYQIKSGGISHLEVSFTLRCLQRLSHPYAATQLCPWQDNWCTGGTFDPVLSY